MEIIDGQLHEFGPQLKWSEASEAVRTDVLMEASYASLAAAGVDGAVLHPVGGIEWACRLATRDPGRFVVVPMVARASIVGAGDVIHPDDPALAETLAQIMARPGVAALRVVGVSPEGGDEKQEAERFLRGGFSPIFEFCEKRNIPVFLLTVGLTELAGVVAELFPNLTIVVDHLGIPGPPREVDSPWWRRLDKALALATYSNINMKLSAIPVYSTTGFPFRDVQPKVLEILDAFGADRVMWGSDISRLEGRVGWTMRYPLLEAPYPGKHSYADAVGFLKYANWLGDDVKARLLGGTARRILRWPRGDH
jgi:L-fuconolactonase